MAGFHFTWTMCLISEQFVFHGIAMRVALFMQRAYSEMHRQFMTPLCMTIDSSCLCAEGQLDSMGQ